MTTTRALLLVPLLLGLAACASSSSGSDPEPEPDDFTIHIHEVAEALSGIATGSYGTPALAHEPIPVGARFAHLINFQISPMLPPNRNSLPTHGPLVLYSDDLETIVFSPLDHVFVSHVEVRDGAIHYGLEGEVDAVPAGFTHRFIEVRGQGIQRTIERWGDLLLADRGRTRQDRYADTGLAYLGYWTDNGAYYYYETEGELNEQDTLLAVKADADARGIPYGYFQLDSWWYLKAGGDSPASAGGLLTWEPIPEMFPDGLAAFQQALGLPLVAHNRWFAPETPYRDEYEFVDGGGSPAMAFPTGREVFDEFIANARRWGVETYEQDWLVSQYLGVQQLRSQIGLGEQWMGWMNDAAADQGLTMQICMAGAAHLLSAVDSPAVTTIRTSIDYTPGLSKEAFWPQFHTVNLLAWALGVWPFKDNFHSWRETEPHAEAEALISILSGGMVGPGDKVGEADAELLLRTCRADGLLLKPDRPALPVDRMLLPHARPFTTYTFSERDGLGRWTYLAAYHIAEDHPQRTAEDEAFTLVQYYPTKVEETFVYPAEVTDWSLDLEAEIGIGGEVVAYDWRTGEAAVVSGIVDLPVRPDLNDFVYWVLAPVLPNGLALLGETEKFVTVADKRFTDIAVQDDAIGVTLAGVPGEQVTVEAFDKVAGQKLAPVSVTVGADGTATATLSR